MNVYREAIDILFRQWSPEDKYHEILKNHSIVQYKNDVGLHLGKRSCKGFIDQKIFSMRAQAMHKYYNEDEIENLRSLLERNIQKEGERRKQKPTLFHLLTAFTDDILKIEKNEPVCDRNSFIKWRNVSLMVGEDLLTTAHLAVIDNKFKRYRTYFGWPQNINSNSPYVKKILDLGLAENHMHLNVSMPAFHLSWLSLMNHPEDISDLFEKKEKIKELFRYDLSPAYQLGTDHERWSWEERLRIAAWLRVRLFKRVKLGMKDALNLQELIDFRNPADPTHYELAEEIHSIRFLHGKIIEISNGKKAVLDYAYDDAADDALNDGYFRSFVGERILLYDIFKCIFDGQFTDTEISLFHMYILLKNAVRMEMIQGNQKIGFRNFADYQRRKNALWGHRDEYWAEGYRVAINGNLYGSSTQERGYVSSLEARFHPSDTAEKNINMVSMIDREVLFAKDKDSFSLKKYKDEARELDCFYVLHFPRKAMKKTVNISFAGILPPRNEDVRQGAKKQALALTETLMQSEYFCTRVRGIDACSVEIGCRPETFATEFRFLREFVPVTWQTRSVEHHFRTPIMPLLHATYHAGEDFLDIIDGLRAIDEAVHFLNLDQGDRIGHALALGIDAKQHYRKKDNIVFTTKQDRLDDVVWFLYRSKGFDLQLPSALLSELETEAKELFNEIYGHVRKRHPYIDIQDYYFSWKFRGNHPELYRNRKNDEFPFGNSMRGQYQSARENRKYANLIGKADDKVKELLWAYHFDEKVRRKGLETIDKELSYLYVEAVYSMQNAMIHLLARKGIAIETNPTSNLFVGTIDRFDEHPLLRFNHYGLNIPDSEYHKYASKDSLSASINTDDPGVFDTSLPKEYALIAAALESKKNNQGERLFSDDEVYHYLLHIRELGFMQVFSKAF